MSISEHRLILVIDDDADSREAMSELLKMNGYKVVCAENGQVALDEIRTQPIRPDLIILDMLMPVMDGHSFLKRVSKDHRIKDLPIVVASGDASPNAPGASAVLTKPIRPEKLLSVVRQLV
jgi:CheY-like chemotaxis protein